LSEETTHAGKVAFCLDHSHAITYDDLSAIGFRVQMLRLVIPDLRVESVLELSVDRLRRMGLEALLLDVDGTLKNYRAESLRPEVMAW